MKKTIYLARLGKVSGPFSEEEFSGFKASGKLLEYSWIWDDAVGVWAAVDPAPAPLHHRATQNQSSLYSGVSHGVNPGALAPPVFGRHLQTVPAEKMGPSPMDLGFPTTRGDVAVICHNFRKIVSGVAHRLSAQGCEMNVEDHDYTPPFIHQASVMLNLLDASSGKQMNVPARVRTVTRSEKGWSFELAWELRQAG